LVQSSVDSRRLSMPKDPRAPPDQQGKIHELLTYLGPRSSNELRSPKKRSGSRTRENAGRDL
jgi:hypothetical protein